MPKHNFGVIYYSGQGVPKNKAEAVKWWQKAADQRDADAKAALQKIGK